jgi:CDP-glucose 4,6-dehydratase
LEDLVNGWNGRRVFLTGHTGFKGRWLALWLASRGAIVRGYARTSIAQDNRFGLAGSVIEDVSGDTLNRPRLEAAMQEFKPEVVFHLAAMAILRSSYDDPVGTFAANVMGTAHLLEAVRKTPSVRSVVCVTTDKVYQKQEWEWPYRESDPLGGFDPYSSSKACAEIVVAAYRNSFFPLSRYKEHGVGIASVRAGNTIGGGDWSKDRLIPDLIRGFQAGQPIQIRRPHSTRPWQHVLEPLNGYLLIAERLVRSPETLSPAFNFGPREEDAWTVGQIATKLAGMWGEGASWVSDQSQHPREDNALRLDSSRAHQELGWQPRLHIETALEWSLRWYKAWQAREDMRAFTLSQIADFEGLGR